MNQISKKMIAAVHDDDHGQKIVPYDAERKKAEKYLLNRVV